MATGDSVFSGYFTEAEIGKMRIENCPHLFSTIVEKKLMLSCEFIYIVYFGKVKE